MRARHIAAAIDPAMQVRSAARLLALYLVGNRTGDAECPAALCRGDVRPDVVHRRATDARDRHPGGARRSPGTPARERFRTCHSSGCDWHRRGLAGLRPGDVDRGPEARRGDRSPAVRRNDHARGRTACRRRARAAKHEHSRLGAALGTLASLAANRYIAGQLFGVTPRDPVAIIVALSVLSVLGIVTLLAGYLPARQASRIDPVRALRAE